MTAHQATVWELRCDGCNEQLNDEEVGSTVVAGELDRIREIAYDSDWTRDGDGDLCPTCTCARTGHERRVAETGGYVFCGRCDETLLDSITVEPKAAYL